LNTILESIRIHYSIRYRISPCRKNQFQQLNYDQKTIGKFKNPLFGLNKSKPGDICQLKMGIHILMNL